MKLLKWWNFWMDVPFRLITYVRSFGGRGRSSGWLTTSKKCAGSSKLRSQKELEKETIGRGKERIKYLAIRDPLPKHHPVPNEIIQCLNKLARNAKVENAAVYQCPIHPKELEVIGRNVSQAFEPIRKRFQKYTFSFVDCADSLHHEEYGGGNNIFTVTKCVKKRGRDPITGKPCLIREPVAEFRCGLVLRGFTAGRNKKRVYYAVVPAHEVLKQKSDETVFNSVSKLTPQQIRSRSEQMASSAEYQLCANNPATDRLTLLPSPMLSYRQVSAAGDPELSYYPFSNDLALLQTVPIDNDLDEESASHSGLIHICKIVRAMTEKIFFSLWPQTNERTSKIYDIFPLEHPSTLEEMGRLGVYLTVGEGQFKAYMVPCGSPIDCHQGKWLCAIEFVTEGWCLDKGDCGTILYVQDKRDGHLCPFGMFIGKSRRQHCCGQNIYRGVVLKQAIAEVSAEYGNRVTDLEAFGTSYSSTDEWKLIENLFQNSKDVLAFQDCSNAFPASSVSFDLDSGLETMQPVESG